jgi:hypothetical protein
MVLVIGKETFDLEFLSSMWDFDIVEGVVKRNLVRMDRLSIWGPGWRG